jgi:hypothetical protein
VQLCQPFLRSCPTTTTAAATTLDLGDKLQRRLADDAVVRQKLVVAELDAIKDEGLL